MNISIQYCFSVIILVTSTYVFSAPPVVLETGQTEISLGLHFDLLEDKAGKWTLADIMKPELADKFVVNKQEIPYFPDSGESVYWARFKIEKQHADLDRRLIWIQRRTQSWLFLPIKNADYIVKKTNPLAPFSERELKHPHFVMTLPQDLDHGRYLFIRVKPVNSKNIRFHVNIDAKIMSEKTFYREYTDYLYIQGIYYGFILVMVFYNLFIYFSVRDISYLYYVVYIFMFGFYMIGQNGLGFQFIWPNMAQIYTNFWSFFLGLALFSLIKFTQTFLKTENYLPRLHRVFSVLALLFLALVPINYLVGNQFASQFASFLALITATVGVVILILRIKQGSRAAKFTTFAFSFFIVGGLLRALSGLDILPLNAFTTYGVQIGSALEMIFLSLALADRINVMNQRLAAQTTQLKNTSIELATKNQSLQKLDKLKDEFLANTSHELRTPINGIIGIVESLLDGATGKLNASTKHNLKMVVASGQRLSNLVHDILDFSKLKHHTLALQLKAIDIQQLSEVVLMLSKSTLKNKHIQFINNIDPAIPAVSADENRVQQIVYNLVGNAIKFTERGAITLSAEVKHNRVFIAIQDTGIGIPEEQLATIFASFEQADGSIARKYGGTGLGLTISRQLVQLHGGEIEVESKHGEGSTFTFSLPIATGQVAELSVGSSALSTLANDEIERPIDIQYEPFGSITGGDCTGPKILIVDDEPVNIQVLQNQLMLQNFQIITANDGYQALAILASTPLDLILLDLMMPKMSGYEVCRKIREKYDAVILPVIMLTAKDQVADLVQGLDCGANDYLTKPFHKEELLARVQSHIQFSSAVENLKQQEYCKLELETAEHVQALFIPDQDPDLPGIDIASFFSFASQTGGDWYDYGYRQDQQTLDILIGDVTGHGVPSALITAVVNSFYRTLEQHRQAMQQLGNAEDYLLQSTYLLHQLNNVLHHITANSYNMTFFHSNFDLKTKVLTYTSAAHVPCYVYRPEKFTILQHGKEIKRSILGLTTSGTILGQLPDQHYQLDRCQLQPDDVLIWFTDGLTENKNTHGIMFGNRELKNVVKSSAHLSAQQIKDNIIAAAYQHYGDAPCDDDVTLIVGKIAG